jgi:UDP-N-acetylglucosamine 3-dehydrogenase
VTAALRVGLAGLGAMGRNHLRNLSTRDDVSLVAVADQAPELVADAVATTGAAGYADALSMVDDAGLDALVVATPTMAHGAIGLAAIERGIPVLIEKPLAGTVAEGLELVMAARARGVPLQVGHVERFNPAVLELGRRLESGWLGTLYSISSRRAGPFPARIRDVGVTIDLATHDADILSWIAGERPARVYAELAQRVHASHEDLLFGLLQFPSGATGMLDVNWLTPAKRRQLSVVGEEGMFELDYLTQRLTFTRADVSSPKMIDGYATTFEGDVVVIEVASREPLAAELDAFFATARAGGRPAVDGEDGLWAVAIASALLEAAASGRPVAPAVDLARATAG